MKRQLEQNSQLLTCVCCAKLQVALVLKELLPVIKAAGKSAAVESILKKLQSHFTEMRKFLAKYSKRGYLSRLLRGDSDEEELRILDNTLTATLQSLSLAAGSAHLTISQKTFSEVTKISDLIKEKGGAKAIQDDPQAIQEVAQAVGVPVEELQDEMREFFHELKASTGRIEAKLDKLDTLLSLHANAPPLAVMPAAVVPAAVVPAAVVPAAVVPATVASVAMAPMTVVPVVSSPNGTTFTSATATATDVAVAPVAVPKKAEAEELLTQVPAAASWEWEADGGLAWKPFDGAIAIQLERKLTAKETRPFSLEVNGRSYLFDVAEMRQTNVETGFIRAIRRQNNEPGAGLPTSPQAVWEWEDGDRGSNEWKEVDAGTANLLEAAYSRNGGAFVTQVGSYGQYEFDVRARTQKNVKTGFARRIQRRVDGVTEKSKWEWEDGDRGSNLWKLIDDATAAQLEAAFDQQAGPLTLQVGSHGRFTFDVQRMTQTNASTGFVRRLARSTSFV